MEEGYKETDLGLIPEHWDIFRLNTIASVRTGPFGAQLHKHDYVDTGTPIVTVEHLTERGLVHQNLPLVSDIDKYRLAQYMLKPGDIVFSRVGSVDRNSLISPEEDGWLFSGRLLRVRVNENRGDPQYLSYYFHQKWFTNYMKRIAVGGIMPSLNTTLLSRVPIILPPLIEQRKIAAILSTWDQAIELLEAQIAAKQRLKRALMQRLLTGRLRFPGFGAPAKKGELPDGWCYLKLSEVLLSVNRFIEWDENELYHLAIVRRWSAGLQLREELLGHDIKTKSLQVIQEGDFLISNIQASYGAMAKVTNEFSGAYVSNLYTILLPKAEGLIDIDYLDYLSQTPVLKNLVVRSANGFKAERIRLNFSLAEFMKQRILMPTDIREQKTISKQLALVDEEASTLRQCLALLQKQKSGLMQKLLTGQVRVRV